MHVFKGRQYAQKYNKFKYKEEVTIIDEIHNGTFAFVIGETPLKVHVCLPSGSTRTLYKCDVHGMKKLLTDTSKFKEVADNIDEE